MTNKAEWFSNVLKDAQALREVMVDDCIDFPRVVHSMCHKAADLIAQLATELEQVKHERDAAVEDVAKLTVRFATFAVILIKRQKICPV